MKPVYCSECDTKVAEVRDGALVIRARHHGQWHTTVITLRQIREWLEEDRAQSCAA